MTAARHILIVAGALLIADAPMPAQDQTPTFRAAVDAVLVPVSVTDRNRPVFGLSAADFELSDNGVAQQVRAVSADALPMDVTLVLDTSASVSGVALDQFKADVQAIAESLAPNDRVRLISVATNASDVTGLQPGGVALPITAINAGGATSLYNALAAALIAFRQIDRPQLIFAFSDGLDSMSFLDARQLVGVAGRADAALYIAIVRQPVVPLSSSTPYVGGPNVSALRTAAETTGGALYERSAGTALPVVFRQALDEFRASYVLTYVPAGVKAEGHHEITVRVKGHSYAIRARKGYESTRR